MNRMTDKIISALAARDEYDSINAKVEVDLVATLIEAFPGIIKLVNSEISKAVKSDEPRARMFPSYIAKQAGAEFSAKDVEIALASILEPLGYSCMVNGELFCIDF